MSSDLKFLETAIWRCEPPGPSLNEDGLYLKTGTKTDFRQGAYYSFHRDYGHFLRASTEGDFTAFVEFEGRYESLYEQAGLMMRLDQDNWVKVVTGTSSGWLISQMKEWRKSSRWPARRSVRALRYNSHHSGLAADSGTAARKLIRGSQWLDVSALPSYRRCS